MIDTPDGYTCESYASLFDTCTVGTTLTKSALTLTAGSWEYNTDSGTLTAPNGSTVAVPHQIIGSLDVVFVTSFTVDTNATLRLVGPNMDRGFGIAAEGAVAIRGVIDLSDNGAGARDDTPCDTLVGTKGQGNNGGGGGGGGGAFKGAGGNGSNGNSDGANESKGGGGGLAIATRPAIPLGGCDGGDGGDGMASGGVGGDGGGALYIASAVSITIENNGVIDAGGGGGAEGGDNGDGGGGGGSGGMIVLDSAMVRVAGIVVANGGGGGEGNTNGNPGQPGQRSATRASGGSGGDTNGGNGAAGGAGIDFDGLSTTDVQTGGGGGGGGGVGFIAIKSVALNTMGAVISPSLETWP